MGWERGRLVRSLIGADRGADTWADTSHESGAVKSNPSSRHKGSRQHDRQGAGAGRCRCTAADPAKQQTPTERRQQNLMSATFHLTSICCVSSSAFSSPKRSSTSFNANFKEVPGPRDVTTWPSTTTSASPVYRPSSSSSLDMKGSAG